MADYVTELKNQKTFTTNIVVKMLGEYFTIHTPDSGLTPKVEYKGTIESLVVNPSSLDPRRVSTTIETRSFKIQDRNGALSRLVGERAADIIGADVEIWIGRVNVAMNFSEYNKLPVTSVSKVSKNSESYMIAASGDADRMNRPIFSATTRLAGGILAATSSFITVKDDISLFPSSGYLQIDKEFIGYASKDDGAKTFSTLTRGEFTTIPADYDEDTVLTQADQITDNPINIILRILSSGSAGGSYDDLADGIGLGDQLIDLSDIEGLRDTLFTDAEFTLALYGIDKALPFIEKQLLEPCNLRFTYSRAGKLTLALLDKAKFVDAIDVIDEDTVTTYPQWDVDKNRIVNAIKIDWDYNESTGKYEQSSSYRDEDSITAYGLNAPLTFQFKGVKAALDGQDFVDDFASALLSRLANPAPEIQVKTQLDKSLLNLADKSVFSSKRVPNSDGRLNFASELEIISRSINFEKGEVTHKLAFTSFSDIRTCYIAPSDLIESIASQSIVDFGAGRGDLWSSGWRCRLWDPVNSVYVTSQVNEILSIDGDEITFVEDWDTALSTDYEIRFPDYDDATAEQKRYCYASDGGNFPDGGKTYSIIP